MITTGGVITDSSLGIQGKYETLKDKHLKNTEQSRYCTKYQNKDIRRRGLVLHDAVVRTGTIIRLCDLVFGNYFVVLIIITPKYSGYHGSLTRVNNNYVDLQNFYL